MGNTETPRHLEDAGFCKAVAVIAKVTLPTEWVSLSVPSAAASKDQGNAHSDPTIPGACRFPLQRLSPTPE